MADYPEMIQIKGYILELTNIIDVLKKLISFNTVPQYSNNLLIQYIKQYLDLFGIKSQIVWSQNREKAGLFATIGPRTHGGVILSGHTDVVSVEGQSWDSDPFRLIIKNDRLYGRGTADMKGFIATVLGLVPQIVSIKLKKPIHIVLSWDEEIGCIGAPLLIKEIVRNLPSVTAVIIGEPTNMAVADHHKGALCNEVVVNGLAAHSSKPQIGCNAIKYAAKLINFIYKEHSALKLMSHRNHGDDEIDTVNIGLIKGGNAINTIPRTCSFSWSYRYLPGENCCKLPNSVDEYIKTLENHIKTIDERCSIQTNEQNHIPALTRDTDSPAQKLCSELIGNGTCIGVPYCTEAGLFQKAGFSTIVCGPGSVDQAHKPNEYILLSQIEACLKFIMNLTDKLK